MTCIVGIVDNGSVVIGGDSAGVAGWNITVRSDAKVFINGEMVFGFTSSFRMGQLLRYKLEHPRHFPTEDTMSYLCGEWIDAVRECLKEGGYAATNSGKEQGGCFLVGYRGDLFQIDSDYQVGQASVGYAAIGCGDDIALGALHATAGQSAERRVRAALDAAAFHSAGVVGPYVILRSTEESPA